MIEIYSMRTLKWSKQKTGERSIDFPRAAYVTVWMWMLTSIIVNFVTFQLNLFRFISRCAAVQYLRWNVYSLVSAHKFQTQNALLRWIDVLRRPQYTATNQF